MIDFRRQNLTYMDVRFWRLKTVPALKGLESISSPLNITAVPFTEHISDHSCWACPTPHVAPWCSGYHVCLTRRRSRVRASPEPSFFNYRPTPHIIILSTWWKTVIYFTFNQSCRAKVTLDLPIILYLPLIHDYNPLWSRLNWKWNVCLNIRFWKYLVWNHDYNRLWSRLNWKWNFNLNIRFWKYLLWN